VKILVIEDDSFLSGLVSGKLEQDGFQVFTAGNGEVAIQTATKEVPDLVILDLMMPKVDGFAVLEQIKKNDALKSKPVIVFSNITDENEMIRVKNMGANEYMIKSNFTLDELVDKIKSLLPKA
jgi:DNA-binding response OmpR family regulator